MTKPHLYIKKAIPVEAYQWFVKDGPNFTPNPGFEPHIGFYDNQWKLFTLEGWMVLADGCFILKGPRGEYWINQENIFLENYNAVPSDFDTRPAKCSARLWDEGKVAARTCHVCGLGPCKGRLS